MAAGPCTSKMIKTTPTTTTWRWCEIDDTSTRTSKARSVWEPTKFEVTTICGKSILFESRVTDYWFLPYPNRFIQSRAGQSKYSADGQTFSEFPARRVLFFHWTVTFSKELKVPLNKKDVTIAVNYISSFILNKFRIFICVEEFM